MKRLFLVKQIRSGFFTASSNDEWIYKEIGNKKEINTKKVEEVVGDRFIKIFYLGPDMTFYEKALREKVSFSIFRKYHNTIEFKDLVKTYIDDGWTIERPQAVKEYDERANDRYWAKRKRDGYVLYKRELSSEDYKGGFTDKVFGNKDLQEYLKVGGAFGYIGHQVRKPILDKYIEKKFLSLKPRGDVNLVELLVNWLTSTDGRHFGDSLNRLPFKSQKIKVNEHLKEMFNLGYIYSKEEHNGTYKSVVELKKKYAKALL